LWDWVSDNHVAGRAITYVADVDSEFGWFANLDFGWGNLPHQQGWLLRAF
jgi:hypothetical protein